MGNPPSAPSFFKDWKSRNDVDAHFGWYRPERELRVRTAIDRRRRKAKEEQLFAYEMVNPKGFIWHANVDLHGVPADQQQAVETQLLEILSLGLQGVGKTKSSAEMDVRPQGSIKPLHTGQVLPREGLWIITLQTPALICDPARLDESSGHRELHQAYASAWTELSGSSIILVRFFAEQSLAGGYYLHQRFQSGKPYNPYVLTEPGSVFVLTAVPGQE